MHAVDRRQQLAAQRVAGLVVGDDALLVLVQHPARLHARDHALERAVEVLVVDPLRAAARGEDRGLVADVREVGAGQAARLLGDEREVDFPERLLAGVHAEHAFAPAHVRRRDEHLAVEAPRAQQRRVELVEQVRRGDHDHAPARGEAVHLDQQLVERLVLLAGDVHPAPAADGVELVDEDDRRFVLAGDREQPADARGAEAGEHLHERRRRLREELRAGLVRDRLRQQRLAGPRRAVQEDPLRHLRAELLELLRVAQELDDLLELAAGVVDARDVLPADRLV